MIRRAGFTLIELLVVVAVIAVLIGILLPALGKARKSAQTLQCLSQMRNLALAQQGYMASNDGWLVDYGLGHGGATLDATLSWVHTLQQYYDTALIVRSPVDTSPNWQVQPNGAAGTPVQAAGGPRYRVTSYGVNEYLSSTPLLTPTGERYRTSFNRIERIPAPAATAQFLIMAFTGSFAIADHVHPSGWWAAATPDFPAVKASRESQTNAHGGPPSAWTSRSNYAFLDGHGETAEFRRVYTSYEKNSFDPTVAH